MSSKSNPATILDLKWAFDESKNKRYKKGKFLGKGGFAHCYELIDVDTNTIYAGKIVPKSILTKPHQREKMTMEIEIHRTLSHPNIVGFHDFFEDQDHVYILLELCRRRSLMELHKRRKALTEPEARLYLKQILQGVQYLHDQKVIHRDLKLGNLFLNDNLEIKVGDFGLATKVEIEGERKKTLCGTPNYIAPEVLGKKGHSYEVDIWSIGCIVYTLLVGKPPFETDSLKDTYQRIKRNEYHIPSHINPDARSLIKRLLRSDPSSRPTTRDILRDPFLTAGFIPTKLPPSSLTTAPHFKNTHLQPSGARHPLAQINSLATGTSTTAQKVAPTPAVADNTQSSTTDASTGPPPVITSSMKKGCLKMCTSESPGDWHLNCLLTQLVNCIATNPSEKKPCDYGEADDPASMPIFWVSKWVDYSDKYGLGYQLCDTSVGVLFNDSTRLLLGSDEMSVQCINKDLSEDFYTLSAYHESLYKKVTLLKYFRSYMSEHLLKAGGSAGERPVEEGVRLPHLRTWFRTRSAIVLHLSNGIIQINFFQDHTKIIICPLMSAMSYIDESKNFRTYKLSLIEKYGCSKDICNRLKYAKTMCERLIAKLDYSPSDKAVSSVRTPSLAPVVS